MFWRFFFLLVVLWVRVTSITVTCDANISVTGSLLMLHLLLVILLIKFYSWIS